MELKTLPEGNPDIAVMMLLYNGEEYLRQSIQSLVDQTYKNFHLFIVDDASSDKSFEIAREYEDKFANITLQKNEENKGVIKNLHDTLQMIEYEMPDAKYFIWACSDDWWDIEYLEVTHEILEKTPNVSVCQTGFDKQNIKMSYKETHILPSITGHNYTDMRKVFYPCITAGKNGFYNQSIHGLIRMRAWRDAYPDNAKLISYISCTELSVVISFLFSGNIVFLDKVYFHKHIGSAFINKNPNDPLTRLYQNPLIRIWASISHFPRLWRMRRGRVSSVTMLCIWAHIIYFYGVLNMYMFLKSLLRIRS